MKTIKAFCMKWHLTSSNAFKEMLVKPLKPYVNIELLPWDGISINLSSSDIESPIIFCQYPPPKDLMKNMRAKMVWLPMWDHVYAHPQDWWNTFPNSLRIVSFSAAVNNFAIFAGFPTLSLKYYMDPSIISSVNWHHGNVLFYWNRIGIISRKMLVNICQALDVKKLIVLDAMDPKVSLMKNSYGKKIGKAEIEYYYNFLTQKEYFKIWREANIFIAPRLYEGAGMSFIEALARGAAVIAVDNPTMNEYIFHKYNGILLKSELLPSSFWLRKKSRLLAILFNRSIWAGPKITELQDWNAISNCDLPYLGQNAIFTQQQGFSDWVKSFDKYANFVLSW